jgi:hypothetical protein
MYIYGKTEVCFSWPANDKRLSTFAVSANMPFYNQKQPFFPAQTIFRKNRHRGSFIPQGKEQYFTRALKIP